MNGPLLARSGAFALAVCLSMAAPGWCASFDCHKGMENARFQSSHDGSSQPVLLHAAAGEEPRPLLVLLHYWSCGYDGWDFARWKSGVVQRGWHLAVPHFRGPNNRPEACASKAARKDILDAVALAKKRMPVDEQRIYLAGISGGGHMAMVMAAEAPKLWAGVSAWVGISDLAAWHAESVASGRKYAQDIELAVGGAPGASAEVNKELAYRSPVHHLAVAKDTPLDLNAGIHDGHTGSVPVHHTLDAFNVIAKALGADLVSGEEITRLSKEEALGGEEEQDATYGRQLLLRRHAGPSRVTIFEGGHEDVAAAGLAWLEEQQRGK